MAVGTKKKKKENANVATAAIFWVTTLGEPQMAASCVVFQSGTT